MSKDFLIRGMKARDVPQFIQLLKTCNLYYEEDDTPAKVLKKLKKDKKFMLVAIANDNNSWKDKILSFLACFGIAHQKIVGAVMASFDGWAAIVWHFGVLSEFRGGKIARALMNRLEENLKKEGADCLYGFVDSRNERMLKIIMHPKTKWIGWHDLRVIPVYKKID